MPSSQFHRRALLQSGAVAAGAFAMLGGAVQQTGAETGTALDATESVLAWVKLYPEENAEIRLARGDAGGRIVQQTDPVILPVAQFGGRRLSAWGQMRAACARAQALAVAVAARGWEVPPESCAALPGRIAHPATGRSVAFRIWADLA